MKFSNKDKAFANLTIYKVDKESDEKTFKDIIIYILQSIDSIEIIPKDIIAFFRDINQMFIRQAIISLASDHRIEITTDFKLKLN